MQTKQRAAADGKRQSCCFGVCVCWWSILEASQTIKVVGETKLDALCSSHKTFFELQCSATVSGTMRDVLLLLFLQPKIPITRDAA